MVIPPIPPAYTCLLIKNPQQIWLFLTLQKKVEGINTPPPLSHLQYLRCHLDLQKRYYTNPYILSIIMGTKSVSLQ